MLFSVAYAAARLGEKVPSSIVFGLDHGYALPQFQE